MGGTERESLNTAAAHWSNRPLPQGRPNWWQHGPVVRHVNELICGREVAGVSGADVELLRGRGLGRGLSVGCGHGSKELALLEAGAVGHFDLYEISEARIAQGQAEAARRGLGTRITWHPEPPDVAEPASVDLVYWNNALHHMLDTGRAIDWSRASLRPAGVFYMNDYVGPNRFQWSDEMLTAASAIRKLLPERLIGDAPRKVVRPDPGRLAATDPTECADSAAILPALEQNFPDASLTLTGGVIYHLALKGLLDRFGDDEPLWPWLLEADRLCAERRLTHYAVAVASP